MIKMDNSMWLIFERLGNFTNNRSSLERNIIGIKNNRRENYKNLISLIRSVGERTKISFTLSIVMSAEIVSRIRTSCFIHRLLVLQSDQRMTI